MRQSIILVLTFWFHLSNSCVFPRDQDEFRTTCQLIESRHFICQEHKVVTEDGYILTLHRIVHPNASSAHLEPVLLGHGLFFSSSCWLIAAPGGDARSIGTQSFKGTEANNLGFVLSNQGYDVWMTNSHGTKYSQEHVKLNTGSGEFWQFSFDEMIKYDTPAFIHTVLNKTGRDSLAYVGHSQGTTIMSGLLATRPEYAKVIKPYIALAPVAYVDNLSSPLRIFAQIPNLLSLISLYHGPVGNDHLLIKLISSIVCSPLDVLCSGVLFLLGGIDPQHELNGRIYVYLSQATATSLQDLLHYGQNIDDRNFEYYNPNRVGILSPVGLISELTPISLTNSMPKASIYPLNQINSSNIHLIVSCNDLLSVSEDVNRFVRSLHVKPKLHCNLKSQLWNHLDHLWACDVWKLNGLVYDILESYRTGHWNSSLGYSTEEEEIESLCKASCPATNTVTNILGPGTPKILDGINDIVGGLGMGILRSLNLKTLLTAIKPAFAIF